MIAQEKTQRRGSLKQRLLRFSLRTLLLVMTCVAIAFGVLAYHVQQARRQEAALKKIGALGGVPIRTTLRDGVFYSGGKIPQPRFKWLHAILGEEYFTYVPAISIENPAITADQIREMISLIEQIRVREGLNEAGKTYIALIDIGNPNVDDDLIKCVSARLPQCRFASTLVGQPASNPPK